MDWRSIRWRAAIPLAVVAAVSFVAKPAETYAETLAFEKNLHIYERMVQRQDVQVLSPGSEEIILKFNAGEKQVANIAVAQRLPDGDLAMTVKIPTSFPLKGRGLFYSSSGQYRWDSKPASGLSGQRRLNSNWFIVYR